jgi:hypothetical protein
MMSRMTTLGFAALIAVIAIPVARAQEGCSKPQRLACHPMKDGVPMKKGDVVVEQLTKDQCVTPCGFWSSRRENTVESVGWVLGATTIGTVDGRDFRCAIGNCPCVLNQKFVGL